MRSDDRSHPANFDQEGLLQAAGAVTWITDEANLSPLYYMYQYALVYPISLSCSLFAIRSLKKLKIDANRSKRSRGVRCPCGIQTADRRPQTAATVLTELHPSHRQKEVHVSLYNYEYF